MMKVKVYSVTSFFFGESRVFKSRIIINSEEVALQSRSSLTDKETRSSFPLKLNSKSSSSSTSWQSE